MSNISYKNTKFPLKFNIAFVIVVAAITIILLPVFLFLNDSKEFPNLDQYDPQDINYEFQTILEDDLFQEIDYVEIGEVKSCKYYVQSGSFRSRQAAESQVIQLDMINYSANVEKVDSKNDFNYIVVVGPFENLSQTNNAREDFRRLGMDSLPPKCIEVNNGSD